MAATKRLSSIATGTAPLLKWPGGKRFLVPHLTPFIPTGFRRYFEPFLGSGALFFALRPPLAHLSDNNSELTNFFTVVRDKPASFKRSLSKLKNSKDDYYNVRDWSPRTSVGRAARFIYLTNLSFNGIYRVNRLGQFNVPYGQRPHLKPIDPERRIYEASTALVGTTIATADFEDALGEASANDLVYLDPPYTVVHGNNGFVRYNEKVFSWQDQQRLASIVRDLIQRGCHILMTNADHPSIKELYSCLQSHTLIRSSCMSAASKHRRKVTELILTNTPVTS